MLDTSAIDQCADLCLVTKSVLHLYNIRFQTIWLSLSSPNQLYWLLTLHI